MLLELSAALAIAQRCAPAVAPETLLSVVRTESGFNPLALNVNGVGPLVRQPRSKAEAVRVAAELARAGANFDLGLGQINSKNLGWLKLSLEEAFEPCANLAAAARVLQTNYAAAARVTAGEQAAVRVALSLYNTGDPGSITTVHADSARLAFEQLTLLVKESEGGRDLPRTDIAALLHLLVDVVVQMKRTSGRFQVSEVYYDPVRKRRPGR